MKQTKLPLLDYLKKVQYLIDEDFTLVNSDDEKTLTIGIHVMEMDERFYFGLSEINEYACTYGKRIDVNAYHGAIKEMVVSFNELMDIVEFPLTKKNIHKKLKDMDDERNISH